MNNMSKLNVKKYVPCYFGHKMQSSIQNGYIFFIGLLLLGSCKGIETNKTIIDDVASLNRKCPLSVGKLGSLTRAEIEDSCIVLHYYLTEEFKQIAWNDPMAVFDERLQYIEIMLLDTTNIQNEPLTKLYFDAFKNGHSIQNQYHFKFDNGIDADIAKTTLMPDVFYNKYMNGNMRQLCEKSLKIRLDNENKLYASLNLPDSLRSYDLIEDSMFVVGACVSSRDYINVWFSKYDLRRNLMMAFQDLSMKSFAKQCVVCEKGICFRYVCIAKNDSLDVNFTQKELEHIIRNYDEVIDEYKRIETIGNSNN